MSDGQGPLISRLVVCVFAVSASCIALSSLFMDGTRPPLSYACDCPSSTPVLSFFSACPQLSSWSSKSWVGAVVNSQLSLASASIPFLQYAPVLYVLFARGAAGHESRPLLLYVPAVVWLTMLLVDVFFKPWIKQPRPMNLYPCLLYTSPSPRDGLLSRMPSSA